jgi:SAM-dependent methyltransferase
MHDTALETANLFFKSYVQEVVGKRILDVGSLDVNGSIRQVAPYGAEYVGLDFNEGSGVDIVLEDPYIFPIESESVDFVVSSSCLEHSEFFWLLFNEMQRVLKSDGLCYLNAPTNGSFHQFPQDCWRFYPDSGLALEKWAHRSGYKTVLLESFVSYRKKSNWNDYTAVFLKDSIFLRNYPNRIIDSGINFYNGYRRYHGKDIELLNYSRKNEDQKIINKLELNFLGHPNK